jgi:quercetin dioxygenase-like cupin family protein
LVKTRSMEIIRMVLPAGKQIPPHKVVGEIAVQCLEGRVELTADGDARELQGGELVWLAGGAQHALRGIEDATVLVTILL